jgi:exonuclease III
MTANKPMKEQAVPNHRRRKSKKVENNIDSAAHNQTFNQQKQLITTYLSILTLNVNRLHSSIKRHHLANWTKKEDWIICCLQKTHLIARNKHWLRVKGWKKIYQANGPWKQAGVAILASDKVGYKLTLITWDKGHSILTKGEIHQTEITSINFYAPNVNSPNFTKHTLKDLKTYINSNTVVVGDFNTPYHQWICHPNIK